MPDEACLMQQMQADCNVCITCQYNGICEEGCVLSELEEDEDEDWEE